MPISRIKKFFCLPALYCLLLSACVFTALPAAAQNEMVKVEYGPKIGGNSSIWRGDRPVAGLKKPYFGFTAGAFLSFRFARFKQFQLEVNAMYTRRGNRCDYFNSTSSEQEIKSVGIGYGEVPILFKYMLNKGGFARPYLFAGPTYSGIFDATLNKNGEKKSIKTDVNQNDFGLTIGGGITWFFIDRWLFLDARYYHGIVNTSAYFTKYLNIFDPNLEKSNPIAAQDQNNIIIGDYFNSTLSVTFGVSLYRQSSFTMR